VGFIATWEDFDTSFLLDASNRSDWLRFTLVATAGLVAFRLCMSRLAALPVLSNETTRRFLMILLEKEFNVDIVLALANIFWML
jgi:hypothetical protein